MGTFEQIAAVLARALRPMTFALATDDGIKNFVELLGWTLPSVPPSLVDVRDSLVQLHASLADLGTAQGKDERGDDSANVEEAGETLLADLALTIADLYQLPDKLRTELPAPFVAATHIDEELADRALDWLLSNDMAQTSAVFYRVLRVAGIVEVTDEPEDPAHFQLAFERHRIRWNRFAQIVDPASLARDVYGWGTPTLDTDRLFRELIPLSLALGMPGEVRYSSPAFMQRVAGATDPNVEPIPQLWMPLTQTEEFTLFLVTVGRPSANTTDPQGLALALVPSAGGDFNVALGDGLELDVKAVAQIGTGAALIVHPDRAPSAVLDMDAPTGSALTSGSLRATLTWKAEEDDSPAGVANSGTTGISARGMSFALGAEATGTDTDVFAELAITDATLVVAAPDDDGLLASVLPDDGLKATFSLTAHWSRDGIRFQGSGGLAIVLPLHADVGPLTLDALELGLQSKDGVTSATAGLTGSIELGPITITVKGVGFAFDLRPTRGNLGPFDLDVHFKRPTGAGIAIDAPAVSGGGFIGYEPLTKRYSGMLQLQAGEIGIVGICVIDTSLPGGVPGYALLVALRASFPAIQVGFGFALTSVGGLIALNRRIDVDALRGRLATGTAGRILAPADPIRDAPTLFADLDAVFPVAPGVIVFGPTVELVWADLVHFDLGLFIELPGPSKIVLLGSAHASVAAGGREYVSLRVDIVGVLDFQRSLAAFDAVLIHSQLLEVLELTGGAAFRLSWGDQPYAVLTFGGFHPAYNPEPLSFPSSLTRLAMVYGKPNDTLYLRFEGYFAVTSNTLQFGANVEAVIRAGDFNIQGILGYDALIERHPFHFQVDIRASVRVRYKSHNLAGLTLTGALTGPGPIVLRAKVCIELLFFDICFSDTYRLGSSVPPPSSTVTSALDVLLAELDRPGALHAADSVDRFVVLRPPPADATVISAANQLVWVQRQAPLGMLLQRIQGTPLGSPQSVDATSTDGAAPELDWFAPGSFADLTDDQALTRRAFERLPGGLRIGTGAAMDGPSQQQTLSIKQIRLPAKAKTIRTPDLFPAWVVGAVLTGSGSAGPIVPAISVTEERWTVTNTTTGEMTTGLSSAQAHQLASLAPRAAMRVATADVDRLANVVFQ
jgi:hypothetical protein